EETKKEIETAILAEKLQKPEITKEHIHCFVNRFRGIDVKDIESRKKLIDSFVNSVYVYDDKILITFNYKDGTKEISLEEVSDATSSDLEKISPPKAKAPLSGAFAFGGVRESGLSFVCTIEKMFV
ncbi:MAG: hypothetical protein IJU83_04010, partial [Clostridia bacterium]|nr:hypothetical protein [Clostridia bacterium]